VQEEGMWGEYVGKSVVLERELRQKGYGKVGKLLRAYKIKKMMGCFSEIL
jgi:hypothetical protein